MSFFTPFREAIRALFHKRQLDAEMEEEIRHHVDLRTQEYISSGMKPEEARYAALRQFGWVESIKETCREERGTNWIEDLGQDLRHAARMLRKDSGTTLIAVLTLALGLGAVTTQFRIFNGILLRGLPFPNPERLYGIDLREPGWPADLAVAPTVADVREWQRAQQSCDGLAACDSYRWVNATLDGVALSAGGLYVTYNYFSVLGARPILGRDFSASDELPGAESVALISHRIWMTYAGGSADIVGRTMRLEGRTTTIIGVMPPGFAFPAHQEIWAPLVPGISAETPRGKAVCLVARIKEGQTLPQVHAEFTGFARRLAEEWPATNRQLTEVRVVPLHDALVGDLKGVLVAMLVAAIAVLVIACVNVMNLQLARATSRLRELALRGALGASRARLLRLMLTEGLLLVLGGVVAGLLFAHWLTPWVHASMAQTRFDAAPGWVATDSDATVLLFTVGAALLTVLGSSLVPACMASRVDPMEVIKEGSHGQSNRLVGRIGYGLVVGQTGLTCALLIASLLLVKSVRKHARASLGFPTDSVMTARISLEYGYRTAEERSRFYDRFLRELRANPDFTHAALTSRPLMIMEGWPGRCQWEPQSPNTNEAIAAVATEYVSDGYFATLGLQPREGREFEPGEPRRGLPSV
ncbi:MAG TPA: ABC transporter permease, partial [Candidatus Limnocylindria bacterium]|nr:ABC transporter permease [Candidatus Limnocylindria bacterium]